MIKYTLSYIAYSFDIFKQLNKYIFMCNGVGYNVILVRLFVIQKYFGNTIYAKWLAYLDTHL